LHNGLTPWRKRGSFFAFPGWRTLSLWSEEWQPADAWLESLEAALLNEGAVVVRGGDYDRWDLQIHGGLIGAARTRMVIEEHGAGKQMVRFRLWPWCPPFGVAVTGIFIALCSAAAFDKAWIASALLGSVALFLTVRIFSECALATAALMRTLEIKKAQLAEVFSQHAAHETDGMADLSRKPDSKSAGVSAGEAACISTVWENEEAS
jgi:hypothetical protein